MFHYHLVNLSLDVIFMCRANLRLHHGGPSPLTMEQLFTVTSRGSEFVKRSLLTTRPLHHIWRPHENKEILPNDLFLTRPASTKRSTKYK